MVDVKVSSRNVQLSKGAEETAKLKVGRLDRFIDGMDRAEVHFSEERNPRIPNKDVCEVTLEGHGHHVRAKASASDPLAAVDVVISKLEKQLRKLKTKLHRHQAHKSPGAPPPAPVVEEPEDERTLADEAYVTQEGQEIVKRKSFVIDPISVDDAVQRMELVGHDFFLFTNTETGHAAVLYRRADGQLGLIDQEV